MSWLFNQLLDWLRSLFFRRVRPVIAAPRRRPNLQTVCWCWGARTRPGRVVTALPRRREEMELSLIGLNAAGKTSLVNVIATGQFSEDMIPTVGFNMRKVTKGNVSIKVRP